MSHFQNKKSNIYLIYTLNIMHKWDITRTFRKKCFSWAMNIDLAFMDGLILWFFFTEPMIFISPTFGTISPFCLSQSSRYNNKRANLVVPPIFGCCRLVFHRVNGSPQTEAASFLANLFSLVVKSPQGCLCWPSQHHGLPPLFFPIIVSFGLRRLMIRTYFS